MVQERSDIVRLDRVNGMDDLKVEGKSKITTTMVITSALRAAYVLLFIVAIYRTGVLFFKSDLGSVLTVTNHCSMIFVLVAIAFWVRVYGYYRDALLKGGVEFFSEYSIMKVLSLLAGLLCICRLVISVIYVMNLDYINTLTAVYVFFELALWTAFSVFFFAFWYDRLRRVHHLASNDKSIKI